MAKRSKNVNLSIDIVARLKERIIRWEYLPGYRFTEEELSQEFGVSRSPVREALRMLAAYGLIEQIPHRGHQVKQPDIQQIYELYEVRLALELYLAERLAAGGVAPQLIESLRQSWSVALPGLARSSEELAKMDEVFHESLALALNNQTFLQQLHLINERLFIFRMIDFSKSERVATTCAQHLEILARMAAGDIPGSRNAIQKNIDDGRDNVENLIKDALARAYLNQTDSL
jgi:DNA-binding GntR family transcriptional regulator